MVATCINWCKSLHTPRFVNNNGKTEQWGEHGGVFHLLIYKYIKVVLYKTHYYPTLLYITSQSHVTLIYQLDLSLRLCNQEIKKKMMELILLTSLLLNFASSQAQAQAPCYREPPTFCPTCGAGTVTELGGLKAYVTGPPHSRKAVLMISDIYGNRKKENTAPFLIFSSFFNPFKYHFLLLLFSFVTIFFVFGRR